jgi:hypothetical protein
MIYHFIDYQRPHHRMHQLIAYCEQHRLTKVWKQDDPCVSELTIWLSTRDPHGTWLVMNWGELLNGITNDYK